MSDETLTVYRGPWRFVWTGGRLCDVHHATKMTAVDCKQVGHFDWQRGITGAAFTMASLEQAADEWMRESRADYERELPYL